MEYTDRDLLEVKKGLQMNFAPVTAIQTNISGGQTSRWLSCLSLVTLLVVLQPEALVAEIQDPASEPKVVEKSDADGSQNSDKSAELATQVSSKLNSIPDPRT